MPEVTDPNILAQLNGAGGPIMGPPPKAPAAPSVYQQSRDAAQDARNAEKDRRDAIEWNAKYNPDGTPKQGVAAGKATEGELKASGFAKRAVNAEQSYSKVNDIGPRSLIGEVMFNTFPNALNSLPASVGNSLDRQSADQAQREFIAAVLRYDSGAAIPDPEFISAAKIYFPAPGDGADVIKQKAQARRVAIDGLRDASGVMAGDIPGIAPEPEEEDTPAGNQSSLGDYPPGVNPNDVEYVERDKSGRLIGYQPKDGSPYVVLFDSGNKRDYDEEVKQRAAMQGEAGYGEKGDSGLMLGLNDEIAGVGGAIGSLLKGQDPREGYAFSRDVERERYNQASENTGWKGDALEITAGLALPGGSIKTVGQAAKVGGVTGAIGGFGYGEGAEGSAVNSLIGAGAGATLGGLAQRYGMRQRPQGESGALARMLDNAGQAENVTVNRAMVDPGLQPKITGVDATMMGSPVVRREMGIVSDQIETGVVAKGRGGNALGTETGGEMLRGTGERYIKESGQVAKRLYDKADELSAGVKVQSPEANKILDSAIAELAETPTSNAKELAYLNGLKSDLTNDLSVGGLRRIRTKLRKSISNNDLTLGETEAKVLSIMDAASNDIYNGLVSQGKTGAAEMFKRADGNYRERMQFINGTIKKLIGGKNENRSSEAIFSKFKAMATPGGNSKALRELYAQLTPEEAADVAATFANDLGRNNKGDFSTAIFVSQVEKLRSSGASMETIFGKEGAESLNNLSVLAKEHARVMGGLNQSRTGIANDYRSWLTNLVLGGAPGVMADGMVTGAVTGVAAMGVKGARDRMSAKAMMSPKITKWLRSAPKTDNPKAIDAHVSRLGAIAKAEPALAGDVKTLQDLILQSANDNANRAAAGEQDNGNRVPPKDE